MIKYIGAIILYLFAISLLISSVVYAETGENIGGISSYGYSATSVNFSEDINFNDIIVADIIDINAWEISNSSLNWIGNGLLYQRVAFQGIQISDNNIEVTYYINNVDNIDYDIYITVGGSSLSDSYILQYDANNQKVYMKELGPREFPLSLLLSDLFVYNSIDLSGNHIIKTKINIATDYIEIYIDDNLIWYGNGNQDSNAPYEYYAGLGIQNSGNFELTQIDTNFILGAINEDYSNFLVLMALIMAYTIEELYFPLIFNIILIKVPIIMLGICIAFYFRGVS